MNIHATYHNTPVTLTGDFRETPGGTLVSVVAATPIFRLVGSKVPYRDLYVRDGEVFLTDIEFSIGVAWPVYAEPLVARVTV